MQGTVSPGFFQHFSSEQRRASGGLSANQNVGYREPEQKKVSPKEKKMNVASSRRSATSITVEFFCKNTIAVNMTVHMKTFNGKTISNKCGRRQEAKKIKEKLEDKQQIQKNICISCAKGKL